MRKDSTNPVIRRIVRPSGNSEQDIITMLMTDFDKYKQDAELAVSLMKREIEHTAACVDCILSDSLSADVFCEISAEDLSADHVRYLLGTGPIPEVSADVTVNIRFGCDTVLDGMVGSRMSFKLNDNESDSTIITVTKTHDAVNDNPIVITEESVRLAVMETLYPHMPDFMSYIRHIRILNDILRLKTVR